MTITVPCPLSPEPSLIFRRKGLGIVLSHPLFFAILFLVVIQIYWVFKRGKVVTGKRDRDIDDSKDRIYRLPLKGIAPLSSPSRGVGICVIGAGFVGTVTAAGFAKFGHRVVCVEKDPEKLSLLNSGHLPFFERDLEELVKSGLKSGRLIFDSNLEKSVEGRKAVFMTVGTPCANGGRADISTLKGIISVLSGKMKPGQIFVIKSTVPVGTANSIKQLFSQKQQHKKDFCLTKNGQ